MFHFLLEMDIWVEQYCRKANAELSHAHGVMKVVNLQWDCMDVWISGHYAESLFLHALRISAECNAVKEIKCEYQKQKLFTL